ncbi:MAG: hypothetical protein IKX31_05350 [Muribaculaceae bacterium]|nr:hypothetical protein [Muribaculaceae bacterium]
MKKLVYIFFVFVALSAAVGCGRSVDRRLVLADTLMWVNPDSSLAILNTINRDSLQGDENYAYYALLLTQAQFRCNIPLTSDTLISKAVDYYSDNHNREYYTRALLYKGGAYEDMGDPVAAIKWYKQAEDNADTTDYRNLAQINIRLGDLYYHNYASNNLDLEKFKTALYYYEKLNDKRMVMISLIDVANVYRATDSKEAKNLYSRAELLAKEINDSNNLYRIFISHAVLCLNDSIPLEEGKYFSNRAWEIAGGFKENCDYYILSDIYARLGNLDSAEYYLKHPVANENTAYDNVVRYKCMMDIELAKNNLSEYNRLNKLYEHLVDSLEHNKEKYALSKFESEFDNERIASKDKKVSSLNKTIYYLIASFLALALVVTIFFIVYHRKVRGHQHRIVEELRDEGFDKYEELRNNLLDFDNHFSKTMNEKLKSFEEIMAGAYSPQQDSKSNEVVHKIAPIKDSDTKFWEGLYAYINIKHDGAMDKIANDYPQLSASDLNFIKLMCCGFSDAAIAVCRNYRHIDSVKDASRK